MGDRRVILAHDFKELKQPFTDHVPLLAGRYANDVKETGKRRFRPTVIALNICGSEMGLDIPELSLGGAPLGIGGLLKAAGLVSSGSEGLRMVEQGGVRIDGATVSDKGLKVAAGTFVLQVGKRKFARVTVK